MFNLIKLSLSLLSLCLMSLCSLTLAEPGQTDLHPREEAEQTQAAHDRVSDLGCGSSKQGERSQCDTETVTTRLDEIKRLYTYALRLAPRSVDKKLKQAHRSWRKHWKTLCSSARELGSCDPVCLGLLDQRLSALRALTKVPSLLIVTSTISKVDSHVYGVAERTLTYEQVYPSRDSKLLSKRAARIINKRLRPTKRHRKILNDKKMIYSAKRELVIAVEHLLGIRQRSDEWCAGCNGAASPDEVYQWYLRRNLKPLKPSHLFGGQHWRSKLAKVFGEAYHRCSQGLGFPSKETIRLMSSHVNNWSFESEGISFEFHLAYYHAERCLITWNEISAAGIKIKLRPKPLS